MKHTLSKIIALVLFVVIGHTTFAQDIIVTTDSRKIEAKVTEVSKSEIRYKEQDNLDGPTFVLGVDEINTIIYANGKVVLYGSQEKSIEENNAVQPVENIDEGTIEILLLTGEKIYAQIKDLGKDILSYYALDGSYRTMATSRVEKVTFLKNGQVKTYNEKPIVHEAPVLPTVQTQANAKKDMDIARVNNISGLFVFTDCDPLADYEIIGEVAASGALSIEIQYSGAQYQSVRDELIRAAKAANNQVEGVMLTLVTGGVDKAYMVKFKNPSEDHSLARVKRYSGVYIFCDSSPLANYEYIGNLKGKFTFIPQYSNLRDDFVKKCIKGHKNANGIIMHLVTGGKDSAEAIKL